MRDDDHGHMLVGKVADDLEHALGEFGVKGAGGLVEKQHVGVQGQGARDGHTLLLAAGELAGNHVLLALQPHFHQKLVRLGHDLVLRALLHGQRRVGDVLQHRVVREQVEVLEYQAEARFRLREHGLSAVHRAGTAVGCHGKIAVGQAAAVKGFQQRHAAQERGFAAAGRADDGDDLTLLHRQGDIFEHLGLTEAFTCVRKGNKGVSHDSSSSFSRRG